jgi:hypothetical protein
MTEPMNIRKERRDYEAERDRLATEYWALLERASIADRVRRATEDRSTGGWGGWHDEEDLPSRWSSTHEHKREELNNWRDIDYRHRVRATVFEVPDDTLRKEIIAKNREIDRLTETRLQTDLGRAYRKTEAIKRSRLPRILYAILFSMISVIVAYSVFGLIEALVGITGVFVFWIFGRRWVEQSFEETVKAATEKVEELRHDLDESVERRMFSSWEESRGEPDDEKEAESYRRARVRAAGQA